jgi:hypothetical protein
VTQRRLETVNSKNLNSNSEKPALYSSTVGSNSKESAPPPDAGFQWQKADYV